MRGALLLIAAAVAGLTLGGPIAHADPPNPPTPPGCHSCGGPPVPPTPVATLGQGTVPVVHTVSVEVTPLHVKRGGTTKASVSASTDDKVTLAVHYNHGKTITYHGTVGASGKLIKQWKVPKNAPLGKAAVKVTVQGSGDPYVATATLLITR